MKKEIDSKLDELMKKHQERLRSEREIQEKKAGEKSIFNKEFEDVKKNIIIPTLNEIMEKLKSSGHECTITESKGASAYAMTETEKRISFNVKPAKVGDRIYSLPSSLTFCAIPHLCSIILHEKICDSRGGSMETGRGSYSPRNLTSDIIEKEVLAFLEEVFSRD